MTNPKLRFKREDGTLFPDWARLTIGDVLTIKHGRDYKNLPDGDIPVLGTGGQIATVGEALCDWPCVLIGRKGTINKPLFMDKPFWSVDTLFYSQPKSEQNPKFQYYLFETIDWLKFNEASGVPSLSASTIEKIEIQVPTFEEQSKTEVFFSAVDEKISLLERKLATLEKLKKGLMQKIFRQEIRFKQKDGKDFPEWTVKSLSEVARVGDVDHRMPASVSEGVPYLMTGDFAGGEEIDFSRVKRISEEDFENLSRKIRPEWGDIILARYASIGAVKYIDFNRKFTVSYSCVIIKCCMEVNSKFIYYCLKSDDVQNQVRGEVNASSQANIGISSVKGLKLKLPCLDEQDVIARFLSAIDMKIKTVRNGVELLRKQKRAFMQQMFV